MRRIDVRNAALSVECSEKNDKNQRSLNKFTAKIIKPLLQKKCSRTGCNNDGEYPERGKKN